MQSTTFHPRMMTEYGRQHQKLRHLEHVSGSRRFLPVSLLAISSARPRWFSRTQANTIRTECDAFGSLSAMSSLVARAALLFSPSVLGDSSHRQHFFRCHNGLILNYGQYQPHHKYRTESLVVKEDACYVLAQCLQVVCVDFVCCFPIVRSQQMAHVGWCHSEHLGYPPWIQSDVVKRLYNEHSCVHNVSVTAFRQYLVARNVGCL